MYIFTWITEFNYENGVINGKANIKGTNGDKEACVYVKGVKHGPATYFWKAGHREDFQYDQGVKNGKAILKGASGACREGTKKNGKWHGSARFTSQDGETKDEKWDMGRKIWNKITNNFLTKSVYLVPSFTLNSVSPCSSDIFVRKYQKP